MTEEEKSEKYCKESKDFVKYTSETYRERLKKAYLDGLVEGRTEQRRLQIAYSDVLEKENAELKKRIEELEKQLVR